MFSGPGWKVLLSLGLISLMGALTTASCERPREALDLGLYERSVFSQSGEDGVIQRLFESIEPTRRFAVEFGCSDGVTGSNVRNLIVNHGWSGLLMDGDADAVRKARAAYADYPAATVAEEWIYPGNVELLFEKYGVPADLDLLVIDIDSNDYYVWRVIRDYRPKVVIIEFNPNFPPPQKVVVEFHPMNYWEGSDYYGASIQSLYELGRKLGYELVHCTSAGTNLFFVDRKYYDRLNLGDTSPAALYRPPQYGLVEGGRAPNGHGHPPWDTFAVERDGEVVYPYRGDLVWENLRIPKRFVELPR